MGRARAVASLWSNASTVAVSAITETSVHEAKSRSRICMIAIVCADRIAALGEK